MSMAPLWAQLVALSHVGWCCFIIFLWSMVSGTRHSTAGCCWFPHGHAARPSVGGATAGGDQGRSRRSPSATSHFGGMLARRFGGGAAAMAPLTVRSMPMDPLTHTRSEPIPDEPGPVDRPRRSPPPSWPAAVRSAPLPGSNLRRRFYASCVAARRRVVCFENSAICFENIHSTC